MASLSGKAKRKFTAAQAAQKLKVCQVFLMMKFTAAQAAQKSNALAM